MARTPQDSRIQTRAARLKLKPRKHPFWRQVNVGVFVGYAKGGKRASWIARWRTSAGYREQRIGAADDSADADGSVTLTYGQAVEVARKIADGMSLSTPRFYGDGMTVSDALDKYLAWRNEDRPHSSANITDARALNRHVRPQFGIRTVNGLTTGELSKWLLSLSRSPPTYRAPAGGRKQRTDVDLSNEAVRRKRRLSANRVWNAFRAALNYAWRDERNGIDSDAAWRRVKPLDVSESEAPRMLDLDEIDRLLNRAAPDFRNILQGALFTGARYGELTKIKVGDFLSESACVVIRQGKTGKVLTQPLTDEGAAFFESLCVGRDPDAYVFLRANGSPWNKSEQARPMGDAMRLAKIEGASFKTTRATYGKLLLLATKDIELVARALGHSDSRITRKHYAQHLPSELVSGIRKMPKLGVGQKGDLIRFKTRRGA